MLPGGAQAEHDVVGERVDPLQPLLGNLGQQVRPRRVVLVGSPGDRGPREPELLRTVVGDDQQTPGAVGEALVLGVVLHPGAPAADRARR